MSGKIGKGDVAAGDLLRRLKGGVVVAEARVVEGGFEYSGKVYTSISAAAMQALRDLGKNPKAVNGWEFFSEIVRNGSPALFPSGQGGGHGPARVDQEGGGQVAPRPEHQPARHGAGHREAGVLGRGGVGGGDGSVPAPATVAVDPRQLDLFALCPLPPRQVPPPVLDELPAPRAGSVAALAARAGVAIGSRVRRGGREGEVRALEHSGVLRVVVQCAGDAGMRVWPADDVEVV